MYPELKRDVRQLTSLLGQIIRERTGPEGFLLVEDMRNLAKQIRQDSGNEVLERKDKLIGSLGRSEAELLARAFTLYFLLVNLAEERQRQRRLIEAADSREPYKGSLARGFRHLVEEHGIEASSPEGRELLETTLFQPVLTAHPTEARRPTITAHMMRINRLYSAIEQRSISKVRRQELENRLLAELESLWLTEQTRSVRPTIEEEVERVLFYFKRSIIPTIPLFYRELARVTQLDQIPMILKFGSWVGGDRDGNPFVTAPLSLRTFKAHHRLILRHYQRAVRGLSRQLSHSDRLTSVSRELLDEIQDEIMYGLFLDRPTETIESHEVYRRYLRMVDFRLRQTRRRKLDGFRSPNEFLHLLRILDASLRQNGVSRTPDSSLRDLILQVETFGFHLATLDFRDHSNKISKAARNLLGSPGSLRPERVKAALQEPQLPGHPEGELGDLVDQFRAMRRIQDLYGSEASNRYIISMTHRPIDMWNAILLASTAGLVRQENGTWRSRLDFVPLFETIEDLRGATKLLRAWFDDPVYRAILSSRKNVQEIMLGYSDSNKDGGYVAANWELFRTQRTIVTLARKYGIRVRFFHGKGGPIDRGGGLSYRTIIAQPYSAAGGEMRITEQGEVISSKYSNPVIALRNLEQLFSAVLQARMSINSKQPTIPPEWNKVLDHLSQASLNCYQGLVWENRRFAQFFFQATPIDVIEHLTLGSRPAKRPSGKGLRDLRAIPWVFSWTQSRFILSAWYGLGTSLLSFVRDQGPSGMNLLRKLYGEWAFFSTLIDNAQLSLAKADLFIAKQYAALVEPAELGKEIFSRIEEEFRLTVEKVLEITEQKELLDKAEVLRESIRLRNPYVDPLNFLQIRFLKEWRQTGDPETLLLLRLTVHGIASGMKSTG